MTCENVVILMLILYMSLAFLLVYIFHGVSEKLTDIKLKIDDLIYSKILEEERA